MLTEQQRERMYVELRRAGFRDQVEIQRIVDLAERLMGESARRSARQWRKLYEEAKSRHMRAALVVSRHLEGWLTELWQADRRAQEVELEALSEQEVSLLELDGARAIGRPW